MRSPRPPFDLRAALSHEIEAAAAQLDTAAADPDAIHKCRVHLKRARALARIGRTSAPGLASLFDHAAHTLMRTLAPARDLAALVEAARTASIDVYGKQARALMRVATALDAMRDAVPPVELDDARAGVRDLLALAHVWPETSLRQVRKGAKAVAKRARRARRRGLGSESPARRHAWRRREKERLFASLLMGDAWPNKRRRKLAERLADALGRERDVLLLIERLEAKPALLEGRPKSTQRAMQALHARLDRLFARSDAFGAKMESRGA